MIRKFQFDQFNKGRKKLVKHIVMWNLKDEKDGDAVKNKLLSMSKEIEEIKNIQVGLNVKTGGTTHDVILITEHDSFDNLQKYQDHPYHLEIKKFIPKYCKDRVCVDFEF